MFPKMFPRKLYILGTLGLFIHAAFRLIYQPVPSVPIVFKSSGIFLYPPSKTQTHIKSMGTAVYRPKAPTFTPSPYSFRGCACGGNEAVYTHQLVEIQTPPTLWQVGSVASGNTQHTTRLLAAHPSSILGFVGASGALCPAPPRRHVQAFLTNLCTPPACSPSTLSVVTKSPHCCIKESRCSTYTAWLYAFRTLSPSW